jgi:hypothetical protein
MAKFTALEPPFEPLHLLDAKKWVVVVTWGHSLRQRIDAPEFRSKMEAEGWISSNARSWLEVENLHLTARRLDTQLNALESRSTVGASARRSSPTATISDLFTSALAATRTARAPSTRTPAAAAPRLVAARSPRRRLGSRPEEPRRQSSAPPAVGGSEECVGTPPTLRDSPLSEGGKLRGRR